MASIEEDNYIRKLWQSADFPGSFCGIVNFQRNLKEYKNIEVTQKRLKDILSYLPSYLQNATKRKRFERRKYFVHGFRQLFQADLSEMKTSDNY